MDGLSRLIDKSLVVVVSTDGPPGVSVRYRLLEALRQYGHELVVRSEEEAGLRARHARYYALLCAEAEHPLHGPDQIAWLGSLNTEISTCGFWAKDLRTFDDLKKREVVVGSTGPASAR